MTRLLADGSGLAWSTYLGGEGDDAGRSVAIAADGSVVVGGDTRSFEFPTTAGAAQEALAGATDLFAARILGDATGIVWATYLGGTGEDSGGYVGSNTVGEVFIGGRSSSTDFPVTPGAYDTTPNGAGDGVVARISAPGSAVQWATYLGGSGTDTIQDLTLDPEGVPVVAGSTGSSTFPTTPGVVQETPAGLIDGFVTKVSADGSGLDWSTFLGGSGSSDSISGVVVDIAGQVYVAGSTNSADFPVSAGAADPTLDGIRDAFVAELAFNVQAITYATYLGGGSGDSALGLAVDDGDGWVTAVGLTESTDFPTTTGADQPVYGGGFEDSFVAVINPDAGSGGPTPGTCAPGTATAALDANDVRAGLTTTGGLFRNAGGVAYTVPLASGINPLFQSSLWVGATAAGQDRVAGATYGNFEFWPGPLDPGGTLPTATCRQTNANGREAWDRIYTVRASDVAAYEATGALTDDLQDWPVGLGAPTVDATGEPVVPSSRDQLIDLAAGQRPVVYGSQTAFWVMNDVGNTHVSTGSPPLGIEVQVSAFAIADPATPALDQATFYRYTVVNRSGAALDATRVGFFTDVDLGDPGDDYAGSDPTRGLSFVYNADNDDSPGYGTPPPAIGVDLLSGAGSAGYSINGDPALGEPGTLAGYASRLRGLWNDGTPITEGGNGYQTGGAATPYAFPGDPEAQAFWSEVNTDGSGADSPFGDRRSMIVSNGVALQAGEARTVDLGIVFARGTNNLNSVTLLKAASDLVQARYDDGSLFDTVGPMAQAVTWTGAAGDGLWATAGNWSPAVVPGPADDVVIAGGPRVTLTAPRTVQALTLSGAAVLNLGTQTLTVTDSLAWLGGSTLEGPGSGVEGVLVAARATLRSGAAPLRLDGARVSLGGNSLFEATAPPTLEDLIVLNRGDLLVRSDGTLTLRLAEGATVVPGAEGGTISNFGTVLVDASAGTRIGLRLINVGLIQQRSGTLALGAGMQGLGPVEMLSGASLTLDAFAGASAPPVYELQSFSQQTTSSLRVAPGATLLLAGIMARQGPAETLAGAPQAAGPAAAVWSSGARGRSAAGADAGYGAPHGRGSTLFVNDGIIRVNGLYMLAGGITMLNNGLFEIDGPLSITDGYTVDNTADGTIRGTSTLSLDASVTFSNSGVLDPVGILTTAVPAGLPLGAPARLSVRLAGTEPGTGHDQLRANGTVQLGGTLVVTVASGYTPAPGDAFTVLTADALDGTFGACEGCDLGNGQQLAVTYAAGAVVLTVPGSQAGTATGGPTGPATVGQDLPVAITVDGFTPTSGTLFYQPVGASGYASLPLTRTDGVWTGTIPGAAVTLRGVAYYASFTDGAQTVTLPAAAPSETPALARVAVPAAVSTVPPPPDASYRMVSVPLVLADPALRPQLEDDYGPYVPDGSAWRALRWLPAENRYADVASDGLAVAPGVGFWLATRTDAPFDVDGGESVDASEPAVLTLASGWNQVGSPFAFRVAWPQVSGVSVSALLPYGPTPDGGLDYLDPVTVMEPWVGYFAYNGFDPDVTVTVSIPPVEAASARPGAGLVAGRWAPEDQYRLRVGASVAGTTLRDTQNRVGFAVGARTGADSLDVADLPPVAGLQLGIVQDSRWLSQSVVADEGEGAAWDVAVTAPARLFGPDGTLGVTVALTDEGVRPEGYAVTVFDLDRQTVLPAPEAGLTVTLSSSEAVRRLRVVVGTAALARRAGAGIPLEAPVFGLGASYPNPSRGSASIPYGLSSRGATVVEVFDVLGRRVAVLSEGVQDAGRYVARWGGSAAPGTYVVRLRSGTSVDVQRLTVVR